MAHCLQMQTLFLSSGGTRAREAGLKVTVLHQQTSIKPPSLAPRHSLGWPHKGQVNFEVLIKLPGVFRLQRPAIRCATIRRSSCPENSLPAELKEIEAA